MRHCKNLWIHLQKKFKMKRKTYFDDTCDKKAGQKLNWSKMMIFSLPERVCPEISRKEERFRRHADLFQLDYVSVFFTRMRPLHRVVLSKLLGRRRKTLCCRGIFLSPPVVCHERYRRYSLPIPRTILARIWIELCNFAICAKPYARLHEILVHSSLKIETAYNWKNPRKDKTRLVLYKNLKVYARRGQTCPHREAFKMLFIRTFLAITENKMLRKSKTFEAKQMFSCLDAKTSNLVLFLLL